MKNLIAAFLTISIGFAPIPAFATNLTPEEQKDFQLHIVVLAATMDATDAASMAAKHTHMNFKWDNYFTVMNLARAGAIDAAKIAAGDGIWPRPWSEDWSKAWFTAWDKGTEAARLVESTSIDDLGRAATIAALLVISTQLPELRKTTRTQITESEELLKLTDDLIVAVITRLETASEEGDGKMLPQLHAYFKAVIEFLKNFKSKDFFKDKNCLHYYPIRWTSLFSRIDMPATRAAYLERLDSKLVNDLSLLVTS